MLPDELSAQPACGDGCRATRLQGCRAIELPSYRANEPPSRSAEVPKCGSAEVRNCRSAEVANARFTFRLLYHTMWISQLWAVRGSPGALGAPGAGLLPGQRPAPRPTRRDEEVNETAMGPSYRGSVIACCQAPPTPIGPGSTDSDCSRVRVGVRAGIRPGDGPGSRRQVPRAGAAKTR